MNPRELEHLFGEWRQLTEAEGRAIAGDDWTEVQKQQQRKADLQLRLVRAIEAGWSHWPRTAVTQADFERQFRPTIAQLIALEANNAQQVAIRRDHAQREIAEWDRAAGNLRGLKCAYGASADGHWTSYS